MTCFSSRAVLDLLPARDSGGCHLYINLLASDSLEQAALPDFHGELIVFGLKAKGSSHAATARVYFDDLKAAQSLQTSIEGGCADVSLLVAVTMQEDSSSGCNRLQIHIARCLQMIQKLLNQEG